MYHAAFFISNGRCATQWLASSLGKVYSDLATVKHEPIKAGYRPNKFFRAFDAADELRRVTRVAKHLDWVGSVCRTQTYIETGWPSHIAIPLLIAEFGDRIRLVHILRHPVFQAASQATHKYYRADLRNDSWAQHGPLSPSCAGVVQREYGDRWNDMSAFEKCLFWWTEINLYADEIAARYPMVPFLRCRVEDLLGPDDSHLERLTSFLGLPFRSDVALLKQKRVDRYRWKVRQEFDWRAIFNHPRTVAVAENLGYDVSVEDEHAIYGRYVKAHAKENR